MNSKIFLFNINIEKIFITIYQHIRQHNLICNFLLIISIIIENINYIIIIDIIFNKNRDFISYDSYIYFFNPILYYEFMNNRYAKTHSNNIKINAKNNSEISPILNYDNYKFDQLSLIIDKFFKIEIYEQNYFYDFLIVKVALIIFIFVAFCIIYIKKDNKVVEIIQKILEFIIYLLFKPFYTVLLLIFLRNFIIQISENFIKIKLSLILSLIFIIILIIMSIIFNSLFVYAYGTNENYYFLNIKVFLIELILNFLNSLFISIRFKILYSIIYQIIWPLLYVYLFFLKNKYHFYKIKNNLQDKISIIFNIFIISKLITRFITFFLIKNFNKLNVFKIFEIALFICIFLIFIYFFLTNKKIIHIGEIENLIQKKDDNFYFAIFQFFYPLNLIFIISNSTITEKNREKIANELILNFKKYFCTNKPDFNFFNKDLTFINNLFGLKSEKKLLKTSTTTSVSSSMSNLNVDEKNIEKFLNILIKKVKELKKSLKFQNNYFAKKNREILFYYKLLLLYTLEGRSFKTDFYILKYLKNIKFNKKEILIKCIFKHFEFHYNNIINNNSDKLKSFLSYFKINSQYLKITECFSNLIENFSHNEKVLLKITKLESAFIGRCIKKIIFFKKKINYLIENQENPETEKFSFCEAILFHSSYNNSIELFELISLDSIVDNNIYFIIHLDRKNKFIIKKAPLAYNELTDIKTLDVKKDSFLNIFPEIIRKYLYNEIINYIFKNNISKFQFILPLETKIGLIVTAKFSFSNLPTFNNKLYIICSLDKQGVNRYNNAIINEKGLVLKFGTFFVDYFGFSLFEKECNLFKILNIESFDIANYDEKIKEIEIKFERLCHRISSNVKHYKNKISEKFQENLNLLKDAIPLNINGERKKLKLKLEIKNKFITNEEKYFLINLNFDELIKKQARASVFNNLNNNTMSEEYYSELKLSINNSVSSAIVSFDNLKDKAWNITDKREAKKNGKKNIFENLNFFFNFFVIILAVILIVINLYLHQTFVEKVERLEFYNLFNSYFYSNHFYFINALVIVENDDDSNSYYDLLSNEFKEKNININLSDFYRFHAETESRIMTNYHSVKFKNFINKVDKNVNYEITKNFHMININGTSEESNYEKIFSFFVNYFYTIAQLPEFYLKLPFIGYGNIKGFQQLTDINQKYSYLIIANFPEIQYQINKLNSAITHSYLNNFKIYRLQIYIIFYIFDISILCSLILFYLSVVVLDKKILQMNQNISKIDNNKLIFLKKKLEILKNLITNEIKASKTVEELKKYSKELNIIKDNNKKKKNYVHIDMNNNINKKDILNSLNNNNSTNTGKSLNDATDNNLLSGNNNISKIESSNKNLIHTEEKLNNLPLYHLNSANNKIKDVLLRNINILIVVIVYIFSIVFFTVISTLIFLTLFKKIENKIKERMAAEDLYTLLMNFYLYNRYLIVLNRTEFYKDYHIDLMQENLYSNFSYLMNSIISSGGKYQEFLDILDSQDTCSYVLNEQHNFTDHIIDICNKYPIFQSKFLTIITGLIKNMKEIFYKFESSKRDINAIKKYFHFYKFQISNFIYIIYSMETFWYLRQHFIDPDKNDLLKKILVYLSVILIVLILIQFIFYIYTSYFIIINFVRDINHFEILQKFFVDNKENEKQNAKKKV